MAGQIILVTGGARCGKSTYAEKLCTQLGERIAYIASAQILDEEMQLRVKMHRVRRPDNWTTFEVPYKAAPIITRAAQSHDIILFDCVTLYLSNLLISDEMAELEQQVRCSKILQEFEKLLAAAKAVAATTVFVTNEVGAGIVPENALAREYRDLAGLVNQKIAVAASEVYMVVCGIPVDIKKLASQMTKGE